MSTTRQFLVTLDDVTEDWAAVPPQDYAMRLRLRLDHGSIAAQCGEITVVPLPDLDADDIHLQIGFRNLSRYMRALSPPAEITIPIEQARAFHTYLAQEKPGRTSEVDKLALQAAHDIDLVLKNDKLAGPQKMARAQLIITDAICRCLPEPHQNGN